MPSIYILNVVLASMSLAVGLFASSLLFAKAKPSMNRSLGLATFLLCSALSSLDSLLANSGIYVAYPYLFGLTWPFSLLYGPSIYIYVEAMTNPNPPRYTWGRMFQMAWPALIAVVLAAQFYFLPSSVKTAIYFDDVVGTTAQELTRGKVLRDALSALFFLITVVYLIMGIKLLVRQVSTARDLFSNIEDKTLSWVRWLLVLLGASWVWGVINSSFHIVELGGGDAVGIVLELAWATGFGFFGLKQVEIYQIQEGISEFVDDAVESNTSGNTSVSKYSRSALSQIDEVRIAERLHRVMIEEKLYSNAGLSLRHLSDRIGASQNYISQTLNSHLNTNFFDYVNAFRIEEAQRLIEQTSDSIVTIAFEVGFNSRSTFNSAFKKHVGYTPSVYRRSLCTEKETQMVVSDKS